MSLDKTRTGASFVAEIGKVQKASFLLTVIEAEKSIVRMREMKANIREPKLKIYN